MKFLFCLAFLVAFAAVAQGQQGYGRRTRRPPYTPEPPYEPPYVPPPYTPEPPYVPPYVPTPYTPEPPYVPPGSPGNDCLPTPCNSQFDCRQGYQCVNAGSYNRCCRQQQQQCYGRCNNWRQSCRDGYTCTYVNGYQQCCSYCKYI